MKLPLAKTWKTRYQTKKAEKKTPTGLKLNRILTRPEEKYPANICLRMLGKNAKIAEPGGGRIFEELPVGIEWVVWEQSRCGV